jgi:hypothetical protein
MNLARRLEGCNTAHNHSKGSLCFWSDALTLASNGAALRSEEPDPMSPTPSHIKQLQRELASGQVVVVVGSGVSVAACGQQLVEGHKVASWSGLLEHGVERLSGIGAADGDAELLRGLIGSGKPDLMINAAEIITDRLKARSEGIFRGWLAETVGELRIQEATLLQDLAALPGLLATLNYDHLLEQATGHPAITWQEPNAVQEVLRGHRQAILHLHGEYQKPESVVLGLASYHKVKDDPHAKAVLQWFTLGKTLLFVGCGDTVLDPNFQQLIAWGTESLQDVVPRHKLLCRASELAGCQQKLAAAPWLQPIAYGDDYAALGPFLRSLVPAGAVVAEATAAGTGASAPSGVRLAQAPSLDLSGYRKAMAKFYGHLKLEELDATSNDMPRGIRVTEVFIPPHRARMRAVSAPGHGAAKGAAKAPAGARGPGWNGVAGVGARKSAPHLSGSIASANVGAAGRSFAAEAGGAGRSRIGQIVAAAVSGLGLGG